jgi:rRNA maturation endonuclease Nob1
LTTNLVFREFRDFRSRHLAENAVQNGLLKIRDPLPRSVNKAKHLAIGLECRNLSEADLSILALAIEFLPKGKEFSLVTDDHAMQFLCMSLAIPFEPVIRGKARKKTGARKKRKTAKKSKKKKK